jgi:hypothetical protein
VDGHDVRAAETHLRHPEQRWNVNEIAFVAAENLPQAQPPSHRVHRLGETDLVKIGRQIAHFTNSVSFTNQQVIVLPIDFAERSHYVPNVGSNAEVTDGPYVDSDAHDNSV